MLSKHGILIAILCAAAVFLNSCSTPKESRTASIQEILKKAKTDAAVIDTSEYKGIVRDFVISGSIYQQQKKHAEAILEFFEALRYDSSAAVFYAIGKSYKELGNFERSSDYALKAIEQDSFFIPAYQLLADIYLQQYRINDAIKLYEFIVEESPTLDNTIMLARLYEIRKPKEAIKIYEKISSMGSEDQILRRLADLYNQTGDKQKYIETLSRIYYNNTNDRNTALSIIEYYFDAHRYRECLSFLENAEKQLPTAEQSIFYNFVCKKFLDDTSSEANEFIKQFISKIDNRFYFDWRINLYSAFLADRINDSATADKLIERSLEASAKAEEAPLQAGYFYYQNKRFDKALKIFEYYSHVFPNDERFSFYCGLIHAISGESRKAIDAFLRTVALEKSNVDALSLLGSQYHLLNMLDSSDFYYRQALKYAPNDASSNNNFAYSLAERGINLDYALEMSKKALAQEPDNPAFLDTYGWILFLTGEVNEALIYIGKAAMSGDAGAEIFEHLAEIYKKQGDFDSALKYYKKALAVEPDNESIKRKIESINK